MQKISVLVLGLRTILIASFLAPGSTICGTWRCHFQ
jgi:hypothetical protein